MMKPFEIIEEENIENNKKTNKFTFEGIAFFFIILLIVGIGISMFTISSLCIYNPLSYSICPNMTASIITFVLSSLLLFCFFIGICSFKNKARKEGFINV